jgi:hypothetical protein
LDGDLIPEVIVNASDATVHAWHGDGRVVAAWPVKPVTPAGVGTTVSFATSTSPIAADVNGDGVREVLLPSNWEMVVWNDQGTQITRNSFPPPAGAWDLSTEHSITGNPALGDIDGDGNYELVVGGATSGGRQGQIYIWQLEGDPKFGDWQSFRNDERNQGILKQLPSITSITQEVFLLHPEDGGPDTASSVVRIRVTEGASEIDWNAVATMPERITVNQEPDLSNPPFVGFAVQVSTKNLPSGTNDLGEMRISGSVDDQTIPGSPIVVPLTVYVGDISYVYIPTLYRSSGLASFSFSSTPTSVYVE